MYLNVAIAMLMFGFVIFMLMSSLFSSQISLYLRKKQLESKVKDKKCEIELEKLEKEHEEEMAKYE